MKLTTDAIKVMIGQWLSTPEALKVVKWRYAIDPTDPDEIARDRAAWTKEENDEITADFGFPVGTPIETVADHCASLFADPKQWVRCSKEKVGYEDVESIGYNDLTFRDDAAVAELKKSKRKPILRCFGHRDDHIGDNFEMQVYTDPDDQKVIGWELNED